MIDKVRYKIKRIIKNDNFTTILMTLVIIIAIIILINYQFNRNNNQNEINDDKAYQQIFTNNNTTIVFEYDEIFRKNLLVNDGKDLKELNGSLERMNKLFGIKINLVDKTRITKETYEATHKEASISYESWLEGNKVILIKNRKVIDENNYNNVFSGDTFKEFIYDFVMKNKLIADEKILSQLDTISLNDYLNKMKNNENIIVVFNDNIDKCPLIIDKFKEKKIDYKYLDFSKLSYDDKQKVLDSNKKFVDIKNNMPYLVYFLDANNVTIYDKSTYITLNELINAAIKQVEYMSNYLKGKTIAQYLITRLVDIYTIEFPTNKILNFNKYSDVHKAKMVLDKIDYIDYLTTCTENGGKCYVTKDLFDLKTKEVFGSQVTIDINKVGDIQSGKSCANWKYNATEQRFEREDNGCGGYEAGDPYSKIVSEKFDNNADSYVLSRKIAFIVPNDESNKCTVYKDNEHKKYLGKVENCSLEDDKNLQAFIAANINKLYEYKYTFTKTNNGYYFSKYEIIK